MLSRFDYVQYDQLGINKQASTKEICQALEKYILEFLPDGRSKSLALTSLEEAYMWIGKAIRDDQIHRNGSAPLQEERTSS